MRTLTPNTSSLVRMLRRCPAGRFFGGVVSGAAIVAAAGACTGAAQLPSQDQRQTDVVARNGSVAVELPVAAPAPATSVREDWASDWKLVDPVPPAPRTAAAPPPSSEGSPATSLYEAPPLTSSEPALAELEDPQTYVVQEGDTLSQIAECFGVGLSELRSENAFSRARHARIGDVLRIPSSATRACAMPEKALPPSCALVTNRERSQLAPRCLYRVKAGDSFSLMAARAGLTVERLQALNGCVSDQVQQGQVLKLCQDPRQRAVAAVSASPIAVGKPSEPPLANPKAPTCNVRIRDAGSASQPRRIVMLSNGDADKLFALYVDETRKRHAEPDWSSLVVTFVDATGVQVTLAGTELSFGETLIGLSDVRKWKKRLKGMKAAARANPNADAEAMQSDLMCPPSSP